MEIVPEVPGFIVLLTMAVQRSGCAEGTVKID